MKQDKRRDHPEIKEIKNICDIVPNQKSTKDVCDVVRGDKVKKSKNTKIKK